MDIAAIGIGGAGGRIIDRLTRELGTGAGSPLETVHAIETDTASLDALGSIPRDARHAVGQFETGGDGTDGDREQATEIVKEERIEIRRAVEDGIPTTVDAIVIAAGLAGGTGSAMTPALTAGLAKIYEQPVYAVSVLPSETETNEQRRRNTAQALTGLEESATAQIVFDNEAWLWGDQSLEAHGDRLNGELTARLGELFTIGQETSGAVGERVVDTRDLMSTLEGGNLVSVGYASRALAAWRGANSSLLDGLKRRILGDDTEEYERGRALQRTLKWAARGTMTFECPRTAATHGLVVFRGPPEWLRGDAISKGREWLADRAGIEQLRSGDIPSNGAGSLDVLVILSGIEQAPRIEAFSRDESSEKVASEEENEDEQEPEHPDDAEAVSNPDEEDETREMGGVEDGRGETEEIESEGAETREAGAERVDGEGAEAEGVGGEEGETEEDPSEVGEDETGEPEGVETETVSEEFNDGEVPDESDDRSDGSGESEVGDRQAGEPDAEDTSNWGVAPGESAEDSSETSAETADGEQQDDENEADSESDADADSTTAATTDETESADGSSEPPADDADESAKTDGPEAEKNSGEQEY